MEEDTDSDINVFSDVSDTDSQDISENNISEKCLNTSITSLMPYDADDYKDIIFIKMLDSKNHFATGNCITRNEFKQSLSIDITNHISVDSPPVNLMCIYTSPPNGNVTGQGCRATNNIFVKLPLNNMFIALESAKRLFREKENHTFYAIPLFGGKRKRIGNLTEFYGSSVNHGQTPGFIGAKCTPKAMDKAAENGHLDVVKYLHEIVGAKCTNDAFDWAAGRGHLDVVKYLHSTVQIY